MADNLQGMTVFVRAVEAESFSAAARALGLSKSAVSKQIGALEDRLGARLLNRTTRRIALTEAGRVFFEHAQRVLAAAEDAEQAVTHLNERPRGRLRISLPVTFGSLHVAPVLPAFLDANPDVIVHVDLSDRYIDMLEEGFDLAVRIARMPDSSLVARRLAPIRYVAVASPDYFRRRGVPHTPADLARHDCAGYSYAPNPDEWPLRLDGRVTKVKVGGRLCSNNGEMLRAVALAGGGLVMLPTFIVGDDLRAGRLQAVLEDHMPEPSAVYAVYPSRRHLTPKVRAFVDFLAAHCGPDPYWDAAPK